MYLGLKANLDITEINKILPVQSEYILKINYDFLFDFLYSVGIENLHINSKRLLADLRKDRTIKEAFKLLNNDFEHILLYLDIDNDYRKELNSIILKIVKLNLTNKKEYYTNSTLIEKYSKEVYLKCKDILNKAKNSDELLDNYLKFIYLKFNDEITYTPVNSKYILYCPGLNKCDDVNINNLFKNYSLNVKVDSNISICTVATKDIIKQSFIISQCNSNGINVLTSDSALNITKEQWKRYSKLEYIIENLKKCTTEYALVVDGSDTIILNNLDNDFIVKFKNINVPFIFNSDNYKFPCYEIEPFDFMYENKFDRYLNGGVVFGYTDKLLEFYSLAYNLMMSQSNKINSEQFYLRLALTQYENGLYCVDYSQELFLKCSLKNNFKYKIVEGNIYLWDYRSYINWIPYEGINELESNYLLI